MTSAEILSIAWHVGWAIVVYLAGHRIGYGRGEREENRRWRFISSTADKTMHTNGKGVFIVMERGQFNRDYVDPLIRARRSS